MSVNPADIKVDTQGSDVYTVQYLIASAVSRLEQLQLGERRCTENQLAINGLKDALYWLDYRDNKQSRA